MDDIQKDPNHMSRTESYIWHENTLDGINSILDIVEVKTSELEGRAISAISNEAQREMRHSWEMRHS